MLLRNEFTVDADIDTVWEQLLDVEGVATCVPGARIDEIVPPDTYKGTIRLRIGPMTVEYRGQATLVEVDPEARSARIALKAKETRGQGSAVATVRNRLEPAGSGTRVIAETDLDIKGPQAQFGKGVLEDVGSRVLEEFADRLEARMAASANGHRPTDGGHEPSDAPGSDDALDLGRMLSQSAAGRAARIGGGVVLAVALVALLIRGRRTRRDR